LGCVSVLIANSTTPPLGGARFPAGGFWAMTIALPGGDLGCSRTPFEPIWAWTTAQTWNTSFRPSWSSVVLAWASDWPMRSGSRTGPAVGALLVVGGLAFGG